jgi:hypothetical protein
VSLSFRGPRGVVEERWIVYAFLRDNVLHHLEHGIPSGEFESLHRVADVLGGQEVRLNARQLRTELERARRALMGRPFSDLAVSARTRAVIERTWPMESAPSTVLVQDSPIALTPWLPPGMRTLDQVFGNLMRSLLDLTDGAGLDDLIEVHES